jgi:hypothetical protein
MLALMTREAAMVAHGPMPATQPNQNGVHQRSPSGVFTISISQPNRIIDAFHERDRDSRGHIGDRSDHRDQHDHQR